MPASPFSSSNGKPKKEATLAQVTLLALLPSFVFAIGEGAIIPIIPTVAVSLGTGIEFAGFIAGSLMIGQMIGDLPAGAVVQRLGEKRAMLAALGVSLVGILLCAFAVAPWMLLVGVIIIGISAANFNLARHAFLTTYVPLRYRARVLSTLGGVFRAGFFVGPFIIAGILVLFDAPQYGFWVFVVCGVIAALILLFAPDPETVARPAHSAKVLSDAGPGAVGVLPPKRLGVFATIRANVGVLLRLGTGAGIMAALRAARNVMLPLWALSIGMDTAAAVLVIGVSAGVDFALFFVSGWVMDRFGRVWGAVPALLGLGAGFLTLAFTHDLAGDASQLWFTALAVWLGFANGIGSGILMTLGADLAPRQDPAPFLGAWRLITDSSAASVPVIVAAATALVSISFTSGMLGVLGFVGAALMGWQIPKHVPRQRR
ncbi:MFS transporter [Pseudoclavibacter sp. AY1F1]|uniref:MFS transporter n=1 Tax=Pseudoclavibacter sp. AY1F1 TaxID=2080583 RepID=UPI000CE79D1B|nr:MFS transporter [Pseudoclavibacter sp. AY1F1]PPF43551.1 MFS transporter [Pseudoclavibacter sp. AY1F1]